MKALIEVQPPLLPSGATVQSVSWTLKNNTGNVVYNVPTDTSGTFKTILDVPGLKEGYLTVTLNIDNGSGVTAYALPEQYVVDDVNISTSNIWLDPVQLIKCKRSVTTDKPSIDIEISPPTFYFGTATHMSTSYSVKDSSGNTINERLRDYDNKTSIRLECPEASGLVLLHVVCHFSEDVNHPVCRYPIVLQHVDALTVMPNTVKYDETTTLKAMVGNTVLTSFTYSVIDGTRGAIQHEVNVPEIIIDPVANNNGNVDRVVQLNIRAELDGYPFSAVKLLKVTKD